MCLQIGELRSGSPILVELNDFIRQFHKKGMLDVLSFCEVCSFSLNGKVSSFLSVMVNDAMLSEELISKH